LDRNNDGKFDKEDLAIMWSQLDYNNDGKVNIWDLLAYLAGRGVKEENIPLQESVEFLLLGGNSETSTINKYLLMAHLTCLSSIHGTRGEEISPIAWREMCSFFPILSKHVIEKIEEAEEESLGNSGLNDEEKGKIEQGLLDKFRKSLGGAVTRPVQQFAQSYDSLKTDLKDNPLQEKGARTFFESSLGHTTSLMIDRIDAKPFGIGGVELLEKRKGSVIAASMTLEALLSYKKCFKRRD
jgi:hypothetical protein